MSKQFAVLGLGSFGWSVALTLEKMGADVLVVDEDPGDLRTGVLCGEGGCV